MGNPKERKEAVLKKMLPPSNKSIPEISRGEGIAAATLYNRRKAARAEGRLMPDGDRTPRGWGSGDRFAAVLETAAMNETELSAYCREEGLYPEQIAQWRSACEQANDWDRTQNQRLKAHRRTDEKRAPLWCSEQLGALRRKLIHRAGCLTRPQGKLTLTMSANPAVKSDLLHYLDTLKQAA